MPHQLNIGNDYEGGARKFGDHSGGSNGRSGNGGGFRRFDGGRGGGQQRGGRGGLSRVNWSDVSLGILM